MSNQKDNSGVIFKNNYKEKDNQPDYNGNCVIDGVEKEIGCWLRKDKNGKNFFSLSFAEPYNKSNAQAKATSIEDDEPPF